MLKKIWAWLKGEVTTVEDAIGGFLKSVDKLHLLAAAKRAEAEVQQWIIWDAHKAKDEAEKVADKAKEIAAKIEAIFK